MNGRIQLELNFKEYAIIKKALNGYEGKLNHLLEKDGLSLDFTQKLTREQKVLQKLLDEIRED